MSIPIIFGANILIIGNSHLPPNLIWATLVSFITGLLTIHLLYGRELVKRENLKWFALCALALAAAVGVYLIFFNTIIIK
jgi:undecaprenyl pyrophosphate phosphatase UppP